MKESRDSVTTLVMRQEKGARMCSRITAGIQVMGKDLSLKVLSGIFPLINGEVGETYFIDCR
jgi:hypothetical protein